MINPFRELRLNADLSLLELSYLSEIDRKALSRCEDGMYANPLPKLVDYWINNSDRSYNGILNDYEDYQLAHRKGYWQMFGPDLRIDLTNPLHPFRQLRNRADGGPVELTECCRRLCLPLDSVQWFEKHHRKQKSVPKSIMEVLNQIGYSRQQISDFNNDYKQWRTRYSVVRFS